MKNLIAFIIFLFFISPLFLMAQTNKQDSILLKKVDSILALNKTMYKEQKNNPLEKYKYGIEINPIRLLTMSLWTSFSGTFSMFDVNRQAELAFPFLYSGKYTDGQYGLSEFTAGAHYRYFLGNTQNGFYISGLFRITSLTGTPSSNFNFFTNNPQRPEQTIIKPGIGAGIGVRIFSYKGFYWGSSLSFGRYISDQNNYFYKGTFGDLGSMDAPYFLDFEALKFGWAF